MVPSLDGATRLKFAVTILQKPSVFAVENTRVQQSFVDREYFLRSKKGLHIGYTFNNRI